MSIEFRQSVLSPGAIKDQFPINPDRKRFVKAARDSIRKILRQADSERKLFIVGPCSIHDTEACWEYAQRLAKLRDQVQDRIFIVMRAYFEKPRTIMGWKGLIADPFLDGSFHIEAGIKKAREFLLGLIDLQLPTATEFLNPLIPEYIGDLICWAAIGARSVQSQVHRMLASGLNMPVGFKNNVEGSVQSAINALHTASQTHAFLGIDASGNPCSVYTSGNPDCHVVLRGSLSKGPNYTRENIRLALTSLAHARLNPSLLVDCSHDNSAKDHRRQAGVLDAVVAYLKEPSLTVMGAMIESHLFPGNQDYQPDLKALQYGVSITDPCIGWEETEALITKAYQDLAS